MADLRNDSVVGRLLEEISWEGANVRAYRNGGRGRENVLTAEVLWPLSLLPREAFLGQVMAAAAGADGARAEVAADAERLEITLLPDEMLLGQAQVVVQPDAMMASDKTFVLVEAKRIRRSSFQPLQLAREFVTVMREAGGRVPLLLLILGDPPPVTVQGRGAIAIEEAIKGALSGVLNGALEDEWPDVDALIQDHVAWVTWADIDSIVRRQRATFADTPHGLMGTIDRLCQAITSAIAWHS